MSLDPDPATSVDDLPLAEPQQVHVDRDYAVRLSPSAMDITKPQAFVDKGELVSFVAGVSQQNRTDVLNSTLIAQLSADKLFNRDTAVMDWYGQYSSVLGTLGWVLEGYTFSKYSSSSASFSMDKAVLEIAAAALTGQEEAVVAATLDAMRNLPEKDGRLQLFNHTASNGSDGNFQISVCNETDGVVAMKNLAFYFTDAKTDTTVLFFNFSSASSSLNQCVQGQTLNSSVYAKARDTVLTKLGDNAKNFVLNLDI